jgi:hypothetical protein
MALGLTLSRLVALQRFRRENGTNPPHRLNYLELADWRKLG